MENEIYTALISWYSVEEYIPGIMGGALENWNTVCHVKEQAQGAKTGGKGRHWRL